ncbi:MAG: hypothetical protein SA339_03785 [Methanomassiliicoccus sp.]|nr:hypothetical protein [Methanomassiliicoccus sp.]
MQGAPSNRRRRRYGPMGPWWPPWYDPRYGPPDVMYPGTNPWNPFAPAMPHRLEDEINWLEERLEDLEDEKVEIERAIEDIKKEIDRKRRDVREQADVR